MEDTLIWDLITEAPPGLISAVEGEHLVEEAGLVDLVVVVSAEGVLEEAGDMWLFSDH